MQIVALKLPDGMCMCMRLYMLSIAVNSALECGVVIVSEVGNFLFQLHLRNGNMHIRAKWIGGNWRNFVFTLGNSQVN